MPRFNGNLSQFLSEKVEYPIKEREDSIEGTVYIGFIIEKDGTMDSIKVLKGIDPTLDLEALKGVKKLPKKWKPGIQNGKPERVKYTIPIIFKLR
ncbi:MAG TPA: energy transducer TonB [Bacteroidia bacterium]|nr:energy transducer TonB [Bacteroidia bacterium]